MNKQRNNREDNGAKKYEWGKSTKKKSPQKQVSKVGIPIEGQRPVKPKPLPGETKIER